MFRNHVLRSHGLKALALSLSITSAFSIVIACGDRAPHAVASDPAVAQSLGAWLSAAPQKADITYVGNLKDVYVGETVIKVGDLAIPITFTFAADGISEADYAAFASGARTFSVEATPSALHFARAGANGSPEAVDVPAMSDWIQSGERLPTLCADSVVLSSHGRALVNQVDAEYTLEIHQPRRLRPGEGVQHGAFNGSSDPGCMWQRNGFADYSCVPSVHFDSGIQCSKQVSCTTVTCTKQTCTTSGGGSGGIGTGGSGSIEAGVTTTCTTVTDTSGSSTTANGACGVQSNFWVDYCICVADPGAITTQCNQIQNDFRATHVGWNCK